MEPTTASKFNTQIYEEACAWFVECRGGDLDDRGRRELDRWLRKSPEHLSAYLEIAAIWEDGLAFDPSGKWDTDTLVTQAQGQHGNVIPLSGELPQPPELGTAEHSALAEKAGGDPGALHEPRGAVDEPRGRRSTRRWRRPLAVAAAVVLVTSAAGMAVWMQLSAPTYSTTTGEQRSIEFADGSTVELNSRSKVRVRYSEHMRLVELLRGQALFHVAKDRARPFIVNAGGTDIRAVGTQFDVYEKQSGTVVTVVEGRVTVQAPDTAGSAQAPEASRRAAAGQAPAGTNASDEVVMLSAGEQITVTTRAARKSDRPNVAGATAWTQRQLVFDSATLTDVAEEFNRYNQRQLIIQDPDLYDFHISGIFSATDPDSLIRFLRERPGVLVTESTSEIRVTKNISRPQG